MTTPQELHVVFGAGQVGPPLARHLAAAGHRVKLVRRSDAPSSIPGVESVRADASDAAAVTEAVRGASAVYHCMNVAYFTEQWEAELPPILDGLITGAGRARARLVVLDNLYAFGRPAGRKLTEETLFNPCSKKGEIRARLHLQLAAAGQRGDVQAVTGRAADFYGPGGVQTLFADRFWPAALAGKPVQLIVPLDTPHTYHFIPDVVAGLATLGQDPAAAGTFMLPCQPAESTRALVSRFGVALGRPLTATRMPPLLLRGLGLFMPILRELREMAYQWDEPFEVDDARFRARYGALAATRAEAAKQTVEWGKAAYGAAAAAKR
jgi:nucleoside-diphosphate-sugar epimerase